MLRNYDPADIAPTLVNLVVLTLMVIVGVNFFKFAMAKVPVPGLAGLVWNT